jgi:hypothetical protein
MLLCKDLVILKLLLKTLLRVLSSVIGRCSLLSSVELSLAAGKMCENKLVSGGFKYDFTESQAVLSKPFQCQNRRFRVFLGRIFQITVVSNFIGVSQNFELYM